MKRWQQKWEECFLRWPTEDSVSFLHREKWRSNNNEVKVKRVKKWCKKWQKCLLRWPTDKKWQKVLSSGKTNCWVGLILAVSSQRTTLWTDSQRLLKRQAIIAIIVIIIATIIVLKRQDIIGIAIIVLNTVFNQYHHRSVLSGRTWWRRLRVRFGHFLRPPKKSRQHLWQVEGWILPHFHLTYFHSTHFHLIHFHLTYFHSAHFHSFLASFSLVPFSLGSFSFTF